MKCDAGRKRREETLNPLRHGWCFSSTGFRADLLERFSDMGGEHRSGDFVRESVQARAERIITEELAILGWSAAELSEHRKNDPAKLALAARLRRETTLTTKDLVSGSERQHGGHMLELGVKIAGRLSLGTAKSATTTLHRWMKNNPEVDRSSGLKPAALTDK